MYSCLRLLVYTLSKAFWVYQSKTPVIRLAVNTGLTEVRATPPWDRKQFLM